MPTGRLKWDNTGEHIFETGVDHGVLYVIDDTATADEGHGKYGKGVVWNGLTTVSENPSGAEPTALWADNIKYLNLMSAEDFACTIEAYTYPDEFMQCDGSEAIADGVYVHQQKRKMFVRVRPSTGKNFICIKTASPLMKRPEVSTTSWARSTWTGCSPMKRA